MDSPIRLFLVDDHPLVRDGLRARLAAVAEIEVVGEAGNSHEALAQLESLQPDIALMDVGMKDMNGIELAALLMARQPALRVVMLSMYDDPEYVQHALQVGARGYVLKESPASEIVTAIHVAAAGGTFLSPAVSQRLFRHQDLRLMLTPRENEILAALGRGLSNKQIARDLEVSVRTIEAHRQHIKRRLNIEGQAELIKYAVEYALRYGAL